MATVAYTCPFVPAEWIAAHGLRPHRIVPRSRCSHGLGVQPGMCPFTRSFINESLNGTGASAFIVTTVCDQMRRAADHIIQGGHRPVFLMNVPRTWQTPAAQWLYRHELERLGRFLLQLGGRTPSKEALARIMLEHDAGRSEVRAARPHLTPRAMAEAYTAFHESGQRATPKASPSTTHRAVEGVPLALVGGPLRRDELDLLDLIEQAGGSIVLDATETGERTLAAPLDRDQMQDDPLAALVRAYFGAIPDASRRPNSGLYEWLGRELAGREVRGIILRRYVWCDTWHAEAYRMKETMGLPLLELDVDDGEQGTRERTLGRVQAFVETLSGSQQYDRKP